MRRFLWVLVCGAAISVLGTGCKKDDENPVAPGGGAITTFNFSTANQVFPVSMSGGATKAKLAGGTLPYSITGDPDPGVATASLTTDTLTVTPVAAGSTSITITDSNPENRENPPRVVTIGITVSGGGGTGGWGSGVLSVTSSAGNLSFSGTGVWPASAGPSVIAVYDTVAGFLIVLGYQQVSGPQYNYTLVGAYMPSGVGVGVYPVSNDTAGFQVAYNADTSQSQNSYEAISGGVTIATVSGSNVTGAFAGNASLGGGTPVAFSGGFSVVYVRGRSPVNIGRVALPELTDGVYQRKKSEVQNGRLQ